MLPDYEIIRNESPQSKRSPWIELIFSLLIIQTMLFLLPSASGAAEAIPADAIHVRIVANSNTQEDQEMKSLIQEEIQPILVEAIATAKSAEELEKQLSSLTNEMTKRAGKITKKMIQIQLVDALIPPKKDGSFFYSQNVQKALVVTIGEGKGDNWWCALFPKVCYRDEEPKEEPVKFWTWEWIKNKFWS